VSIELAGGAVDAEAEGFAQFVEARQLLSVHCPPGSGFLVETAVTIHHGTAFVFASQTRRGRQPATAPPSANSWPASGFSGKGEYCVTMLDPEGNEFGVR
jgi:hypothetical protein